MVALATKNIKLLSLMPSQPPGPSGKPSLPHPCHPFLWYHVLQQLKMKDSSPICKLICKCLRPRATAKYPLWALPHLLSPVIFCIFCFSFFFSNLEISPDLQKKNFCLFPEGPYPEFFDVHTATLGASWMLDIGIIYTIWTTLSHNL